MWRNWAVTLWEFVVSFKQMMMVAIYYPIFSYSTERRYPAPSWEGTAIVTVWFPDPQQWQDPSYRLPDSDEWLLNTYLSTDSVGQQRVLGCRSVPGCVLGAGIAQVVGMWSSPLRSLLSRQPSGWDRDTHRALEPFMLGREGREWHLQRIHTYWPLIVVQALLGTFWETPHRVIPKSCRGCLTVP